MPWMSKAPRPNGNRYEAGHFILPNGRPSCERHGMAPFTCTFGPFVPGTHLCTQCARRQVATCECAKCGVERKAP